MVEIIAGERGTGKTKALITKANDSALVASGTVIFIDKNNKHIFELSNRIRFINLSNYNLTNFDMFQGFLQGIISQNHNLELLYLDSILSLACIDSTEIEKVVQYLNELSDTYNIQIVVCLAVNESSLADSLKKYVSVSL